MSTQKVDVLAFLSGIVQQNTQHYQCDFDYDQATLRQAANESDMENRVFYWMSRPNGTWCVKEREVFLRGSRAHFIWTYYAQEPKGIKAYRVTITGLKAGIVTGRVYPLDYESQVCRVQQTSLPATAITIEFEGGDSFTIPLHEYSQFLNAMNPKSVIERVRYVPDNEAELTRVLMMEHRIQTGKYKKGHDKLSCQHNR